MEVTQNHLREEDLVFSLFGSMLAGSAILLLSLAISSSLRTDFYRHSRIVRESLGLHKRPS
jgi:hypothetical protein